MIGSIIGVGITNQLLHGKSGVSGVDWEQVTRSSRLSSYLRWSALCARRCCSGSSRHCYAILASTRPQREPSPRRSTFALCSCLLCGGVSFAHGSNDGQKGMGLIMLILVGTVPTAYALNHAVTPSQVQTSSAVSQQVSENPPVTMQTPVP